MNPAEGVASTFNFGADDDPNFGFLRFQNPKDEQWYYWYIDGGEVRIRSDAASIDVFRTTINKDCN